ncbi:MAG: hypothetical protein ACLPY5_01065 [Candidatus Bathyarchaeia archaeon]
MSKKVRVLLAGEGDLATLTYQIGWQVSSANYLLHEDNLANALQSDPEIDVTRVWGPTIIDEFPNSMKDLEKYDVLVVGDASWNVSSSSLSPHAFPMWAAVNWVKT